MRNTDHVGLAALTRQDLGCPGARPEGPAAHQQRERGFHVARGRGGRTRTRHGRLGERLARGLAAGLEGGRNNSN